MKHESILDKIIFSVAQVCTIFGLLMYLFLRMFTATSDGITMGFSLITLIGNAGSEFFKSQYLGLFIFFVVAILFAIADFICLIVRLASKDEMGIGFHIGMSSVGVLISIIMLVSLNILNGSVGYVNFGTEWGWAIGVCSAGVIIVAVYLTVKACIKDKPEAELSDHPEVKPSEEKAPAKEAATVKEPAVDDMTIIELIRAYKQLLDEGAITQEEFDKKKSALLNK